MGAICEREVQRSTESGKITSLDSTYFNGLAGLETPPTVESVALQNTIWVDLLENLHQIDESLLVIDCPFVFATHIRILKRHTHA